MSLQWDVMDTPPPPFSVFLLQWPFSCRVHMTRSED